MDAERIYRVAWMTSTGSMAISDRLTAADAEAMANTKTEAVFVHVVRLAEARTSMDRDEVWERDDEESQLYRLSGEFGGYLDIEIIDVSREAVLKRFAEVVRKKCKRSGGTWAEEAIEDVTYRDDAIELLMPGARMDGEPV